MRAHLRKDILVREKSNLLYSRKEKKESDRDSVILSNTSVIAIVQKNSPGLVSQGVCRLKGR